jgi:hypothetical protein
MVMAIELHISISSTHCFLVRLMLIVYCTLFYCQERDVKFFTETEENNQMRGPRTAVPYFL